VLSILEIVLRWIKNQSELLKKETMNRTNFTVQSGRLPVKSQICEEKPKIPVDVNIENINIILGLYKVVRHARKPCNKLTNDI
jgi:hypothetical protein